MLKVLVDEETFDAFDAFDPSLLQEMRRQVIRLLHYFSYEVDDFSIVSIDQKHYAVAARESKQMDQLIQPFECEWQLHEVEMQKLPWHRNRYYQKQVNHYLRDAAYDTCEH